MKKEHKPKLLSPNIFRWGRGLPHGGVGQKVRHVPRSQGNKTFLAGYPGILLGNQALPENFEKKKFVFSFCPLKKPKRPKMITSDDVREPLKQGFLASRDVIISELQTHPNLHSPV